MALFKSWADRAQRAVDDGLTVWFVALGERNAADIRGALGGGYVLDRQSRITSEIEASGLWRFDHFATFSGTSKAGAFSERQPEIIAVFRRT